LVEFDLLGNGPRKKGTPSYGRRSGAWWGEWGGGGRKDTDGVRGGGEFVPWSFEEDYL